MKLLNERYKLLGIINPIDLLVLLALLGAVVGLVLRFGASDTSGDTDKVKVTYTVRVRTQNNRVENEIYKHLENEKDRQLFTDEGFVPDAYIQSVNFVPSIQQGITADGRFVEAEDPTRVDAIFTIEAQVDKNAIPVKVGTQMIKIGLNHYVKTRRIEFLGNIETVNVDG